jgi:hypothetical protein
MEEASMRLEHSRSLRLAEGVSGMDAEGLAAHLEAQRIVVSLERRIPHGPLAARVLVSTLRRLPGELILDAHELKDADVERLTAAADAVDPDRPLNVARRPQGADMYLHVGPNAPAPGIRLLPDGHGAQLVADPTRGLCRPEPASALGAVTAAALGAAEAFKGVAYVRADRQRPQPYLRFCPVTLGADPRAAAALVHRHEIAVTLVGLGAVGTAIALIISELDFTGTVVLCDPERYEPENRGTYSLGSAADATSRPWKVDLAARTLARFNSRRFRGTAAELMTTIDAGRLPWTRLLLAGLDSRAARHDAQRLWPDHLIDAATSDTSLGLHLGRPGGACLMCFLPARREGPSAPARHAAALGLPAALLGDGNHVLTAADLRDLDPEGKARLRPHLGKPVCGLARAVGLTELEPGGYRPAVPFVSQLAACLAVGRALAIEGNARLTDTNFVQFDALVGPRTAVIEARRPRSACSCQQRAETISRVRASRSASIPP